MFTYSSLLLHLRKMQSRHLGGPVCASTRRSSIPKYPVLPSRSPSVGTSGPGSPPHWVVSEAVALQGWQCDTGHTRPSRMPVAQSWLHPNLVIGPELWRAEEVGGSSSEQLSPSLPKGLQTVLMTFDLGLNRAVPWAVYCAASSSLESAL